MNILSALFGIFRQRGLVTNLKEGSSLVGFILAAIVFSLFSGALYGFAMGIGLGIDMAIKDAIKVGLVVSLGLLLSIPMFWVAYRLLGRTERLSQISAVPLTMFATVAIVLAISSPIVFMLSVLAGLSSGALYIHIVIIDLALLVGLYVAGMLIYHGFSEKQRLMVPNVIGFLMLSVILVVLIIFFSPFLSPYPTFSVGTDRIKDGLGIGVAERVDRALIATRSAEQLSYRFQTTNDNGDLIQDYSINRVGEDFLIEVHSHSVPGDAFRSGKRIWFLEGQYYSDFKEGRVSQEESSDLAIYLDPALAPAVFTLPQEFAMASWRAYESGNRYIATGTTQTQEQVVVELDATTGRLSNLTLGSSQRGVHAEVRVHEIQMPTFDREGLTANLNQAIVLGSVDRSNASMLDYVQETTYFVVRYPRNWRSGTWDSSQRRVEFSAACSANESCPVLAVDVFDLAEGKGARQFAEDLSNSLGLQPEYREIVSSTTTIGNMTVGVVEYLYDRTVKGELETTYHIEYIFVGQLYRYHLDFSAPEGSSEDYQDLFLEMAQFFTYLVGVL